VGASKWRVKKGRSLLERFLIYKINTFRGEHGRAFLSVLVSETPDEPFHSAA